LRQEAITTMDELGIDMSGQRSKSVDEFEGQRIDYVITVCDNVRESSSALRKGCITASKIPRPSLARVKNGRPYFVASGTNCGPISPTSRSASHKIPYLARLLP
jgi:hypothetical protein